MKLLVALLLLAASGTAAAQATYKCKNAAGKITYSGQECSEIGLTSAGDVTGRASVAPAVKVSPERQANRPKPPSAASQAPKPKAATANPGELIDPDDDPNRRCFKVKTAKGTATRCNDTPKDG